MIIPASQASMSIPNMVGGGKFGSPHKSARVETDLAFRCCSVILLVALFAVIFICLFNLRYYIWEGHPSSEQQSWQGWFSLRDREDDMNGGKAIKAVEVDCEKGKIVRNPPLTALHPSSKIRRTLWVATPPQPTTYLSLQLTQAKASPPPVPKIHPNVMVPPAVIIKPRSRKNSEASDTSQSMKPLPYKPPFPHPSLKPTHPSSFEAATGIGMGPAYRPPPPPPSSVPSHIQPNAKASDVRNSIVMEFQHYFNPFSWLATGTYEGKDLDGQDEVGSAASSTLQQRGKKDAIV